MIIKNMEELGKAIDDNQHLEYQSAIGWKPFDRDWSVVDMIKGVSSGNVRIKPEPQKIDLSILVDSGIDCELDLHASGDWYVDYLVLGNVNGWEGSKFGSFKRCRPRMNHWMSWENTSEDKQNDIERWLSKHFLWVHLGASFKITGIKEGYTL
jgi:hypothetical protein